MALEGLGHLVAEAERLEQGLVGQRHGCMAQAERGAVVRVEGVHRDDVLRVEGQRRDDEGARGVVHARDDLNERLAAGGHADLDRGGRAEVGQLDPHAQGVWRCSHCGKHTAGGEGGGSGPTDHTRRGGRRRTSGVNERGERGNACACVQGRK